MQESKLYKCISVILKPIMKLLYRTEITGLENIPKNGRCIICPNHTSNVDPIILATIIKRQIYFMAKAELFKNKILSKILKILGVFPVDRGNHDKTAIDNSMKILNNEKPLGLFIEGTRSRTGDFLRPKAGCAMIAHKTNSPIVPICITGKNEHRIKIFQKNIISIGKPIPTSQLGIIDGTAKEFRDASRIIMSKIKEMYPRSNKFKK